MKRPLIVLALVLAVLAPAAPAWAHNALAEATPKKDAKLTTAPKAVKLRFLQKLNADLTTVVVSDAAKQQVPAAPVDIDGATVVLNLTETPGNGTYTVAYSTVSVDGHAVKGSYRFTVADPKASAPPTPPAASIPEATTPAAPAAAPAPVPVAETGGSGRVLLVVALIGIVLAGLAGLFWWRGRRPVPPAGDR